MSNSHSMLHGNQPPTVIKNPDLIEKIRLEMDLQSQSTRPVTDTRQPELVSKPVQRSKVPQKYYDYLPLVCPPSWQVNAKHLAYISEHLDAVTRGDIDRLAIFLPPRHSKCQPAGSPVLLTDGRLVPIEQVRIGDTVVSFSEKGLVTSNQIDGITDNGVQRVLRIKLNSGRFIDCTENHPLMTIKGWTRADILSVGDSLAALNQTPIASHPVSLPKYHARLLGYVIGDGSFGKGDAIISTKEPETVQVFEEICKHYAWRLYKDGDCTYHFRSLRAQKGWQRETARAALRKYMKPATSAHKRVPDVLFQASKDDICEFLGGYFSSDGTSTDRREGHAYITSISEALLRDVQHLLSRIGVWSYLRQYCQQYNEKPYYYWNLHISGIDLIRFASQVKVDGKKGETLARAVAKASQKRHFPEYDSIPNGWQEYIPKGRKKGQITFHSLRRKFGLRMDKPYKCGVARHLVAATAALTLNRDLQRICNPILAWDRIVAIEDLGLKPTFGISVENDHDYICGQILSHNTETVTVRYPVQRLEMDLSTRCLVTGYNERVARRFSRKTRTIAQARLTLAGDKAAADEWETIEGGGLVARGVGTPPTGFGFDLILIDDPIKKREEAESEVYREKIWDWYTDDLYTRLEPGGAIILCLTRWHYDDLAARAIASEPSRWTVIKLPALAEEDDPIGRQVGQSLWPERFNEEALERIRSVQTRTGGAYSFESLYQQNPLPKEGAFFKVGQFAERMLDAAPSGLRMCRAWDLAASQGKGDFTAGVKVGIDDMGRWYILDVVKGQYKPDERNTLIRLTTEMDGVDCTVRLTQDPGQAGIDQVLNMTRLLSGFTIRTERASGSKEVRADNFASQVNAGNVYLIKGDWIPSYIEELRQFPGGKHDDQVDATADAVNELANRSTSLIWAWA